MSLPAPNVRPDASEPQTKALTAAARTLIYAANTARLGWSIRNPIGSGQTVYISLSLGGGVVLTDANAEYALEEGDILTDNADKGYCGPIYGSASGNVTVVCQELE